MDRAKQFGWLVALSLLIFSSTAGADWSAINMREGVTEISRQVYELHMIIFAICVVIGILVFGTMIVSMLMHRKSIGAKPASYHDNTRVEILWTIIPIIILVAMAIPATTTLNAMYDSGEPDIDIEVRGFQWKWQYTYLSDDPTQEVKFMSSLLT
ncbi:MAG: cytochrome c oxidase subunit II transmembrane domain-containing protein, partial [Pseudomonadales bacterium]